MAEIKARIVLRSEMSACAFFVNDPASFRIKSFRVIEGFCHCSSLFLAFAVEMNRFMAVRSFAFSASR